jgi:hypothetical protein
MFQFMRTLDEAVVNRTGGHLVVIDTTAKLNMQFGSLPVENQQDILNAAAALGYDSSFIASNTQVRTILKTFSDVWGNQTFPFGIAFNL